jgi:hypothetical protein
MLAKPRRRIRRSGVAGRGPLGDCNHAVPQRFPPADAAHALNAFAVADDDLALDSLRQVSPLCHPLLAASHGQRTAW